MLWQISRQYLPTMNVEGRTGEGYNADSSLRFFSCVRLETFLTEVRSETRSSSALELLRASGEQSGMRKRGVAVAVKSYSVATTRAGER